MSGLIAALDFGTSGVKAALVDSDGRVTAGGYSTYGTTHGTGGVVEQDASSWWSAGVDAIRQCGQTERDAVVALAVTGEMQDLILVDDRSVLRPVMLYSDLRATEQHAALVEKLPEWDLRAGFVQDASNVAAKIAWLRDHEPDRLERASTLLFSAGGYILWRAGGEAACDLISASSTGLVDNTVRGWYHDAVAASGARADQLPKLITDAGGSDACVGALRADAAAQFGLPEGIPLVMALGDAGATTDGLVGSDIGRGYIYLGTTGWFARFVDRGGPALHPSSYLHALAMPGWASALSIGAVLSAGSSADWARRQFLPELRFAEADAAVLSRLDDVGAQPILCLPGLTGERAPVRDPNARGAFVGVGEGTERIDLYAAVLTGVALSIRHAADDMGGAPDEIPVVGGAAVSPAWLQIIADVFERPVRAFAMGEPSTLSAARTAASVLGMPARIRPICDRSETLEAGASRPTLPTWRAPDYRALIPAHRNLYQTLAPTFSVLAALEHPDGRKTSP